MKRIFAIGLLALSLATGGIADEKADKAGARKEKVPEKKKKGSSEKEGSFRPEIDDEVVIGKSSKAGSKRGATGKGASRKKK